MLAGLVVAAAALAVAEALTVLTRSWRSPILDVGDRMVDIMASYPTVKQTAVDVLGNADKPALLAGIGVLLDALLVGARLDRAAPQPARRRDHGRPVRRHRRMGGARSGE